MGPLHASGVRPWLAVALVGLGMLAPLGAGPAMPAGPQPEPPTIRFDEVAYAPGECSRLTARASSLNIDPQKADFVEVELASLRARDRERVILAETGADTGIFTLAGECVPLQEDGASEADGVLRVLPGDFLGALILTPDQERPLALDLASISGGRAEGRFEAKIDPAILPEDLRSTPAVPGEPDFPLALVIDPDGVPAFFGEDQVLYRPSTADDLDAFLERRGGRVLSKVTLPTGDEKTRADYYVIRLDPSAFDDSSFGYLMEFAEVEGRFTYSSADAVKLMAMIAEEQLGGNPVFPHALLQYQGVPVSNEGLHGDWFASAWFNPSGDAGEAMVRAGEALALLDAVDLSTEIPVGIVDGGFAGPGDLGSENPDYDRTPGFPSTPFAAIPQCEVNAVGLRDCSAGSAAGPNPLPFGGPWHGTEMLSIAGAEFNNGFGAAGTGAHAVDPILLKVNMPYLLPAAAAITEAADRGARVINLSSGFPCRPLLLDVCEPFESLLVTGLFVGACEALKVLFPVLAPLPCEAILTLLTIPPQAAAMELALTHATSRDAVITAAAGNSLTVLGTRRGPFDVDEVRLIPCVLEPVVCVGALDSNGTVPVNSTISDFGRGVDIWAPENGLLATPTPASGGGLTPSGGTSVATGFVTGVVAAIRALNPSLDAARARALLLASRCSTANPGRTGPGMLVCTPSRGDPRVEPAGYVDVLEAVRLALISRGEPSLAPCTGGFDPDEPNDTPPSATFIAVPSTAGASVALSDDRSVHALPTDVDWFRFRPPTIAGVPLTRMTIDFTVPAPTHGELTMDVFRDLPSGPVLVATLTTVSGRASLEGIFFNATDYLIRISAPAPATRSDNCYGGTLTLRVIGAGPAADRFEPNDTGDAATNFLLLGHEHFDERVTLDRPDIGEAIDQSMERWWRFTAPFGPLSLHTETDRDFFSVPIPDPALAHPDIHPGAPVEPLQECGRAERRNDFPPPPIGSGFDDLFFGGVLQVTVRPSSSVHAAGEDLRLYPLGLPTVEERLEPGEALTTVTIECPHERLSAPELLFSFGERSEPRTLALEYDLEVEYKILIERVPRLSDFILRLMAERDLRTVLGFACPGGFLPACDLDDLEGALAYSHPALPDPDCRADGPGCDDPRLLRWAGPNDLDLTLTAPPGLSFALFDAQGEEIAAAVPTLGSHASARLRAFAAAAPDLVEKRLFVPDLRSGLYVLIASGTEAVYTAHLATADRDGDGVVDPADLCPDELEDADGFRDGDGCPDADNDGDGVRDASDNCPKAASPAQADLDRDGPGDVCDPENRVAIDIKPDDKPNSINPSSRGTIPVAILSSDGVDAPARVDRTSLTFGRTGVEASLASCGKSPTDVNADGRLDLVCHVLPKLTGVVPVDGPRPPTRSKAGRNRDRRKRPGPNSHLKVG